VGNILTDGQQLCETLFQIQIRWQSLYYTDDNTINIVLLLWQRSTPSLFTLPSFDQGPATQSTAVSHPQNGLKHAHQH